MIMAFWRHIPHDRYITSLPLLSRSSQHSSVSSSLSEKIIRTRWTSWTQSTNLVTWFNNFLFYFADRASQYIYLHINQPDALNFIMSLFRASTCFEHYVLIIRRPKLYYTASGIVTLCRWPSSAQVERALSQPVHWTATYRVWRYQMLYNTILASWWWAHSARNM